MSNSAISFNTAGLASATSPGLVGTGAQTFAGDKTFNGLVNASGGVLQSGLTGANATTAITSGSGKVGELVSTTLTNPSFTSLSFTDLTGLTLSLTAGIWSVTFETAVLFRLSGLTGGNRAAQNIAICKNDNTILGAADVNAIEVGQTPQFRLNNFSINVIVNLTASDVLKVRGRLWNWSGSESYTVLESIIYSTQGGRLQAVRLS